LRNLSSGEKEMDYKKLYQKKLTSPEQAVKCINSGDCVDYGFFNGKPVVTDAALAARASELKDVMIYTAVTVPPLPEVSKYPESFCYMDWHWSKLTRMIQTGVGPAYYCPIQYMLAPQYYKMVRTMVPVSYRTPSYNEPDKHKNQKMVAILQVAPMDDFGYFNFGPQISEASANIETADIIILEENKNVPICLGGSEESVHISRVDYIVKAPETQMMYDAPMAEQSDVDKKIASNVMDYLYDGCCIQLGIGAMPNAIGHMIAESDLKNLGGHTEMFVDAYVEMIESGRMNGSKKSIDKYKAAYTFAIGSQRMYDFMNNNPALAAHPVNYTNDPRIISQNNDTVSINNAVQADLYTQVNGESFEGDQISGNGGMSDFVIGATWSEGGQSFLCLSSTFTDSEGNKKSRIVPFLTNGSVATIPRQMVDFIVTEYGAERMQACPTWMRAEKMISLAHPDFRDDLIKDAEKLNIWRKSNKI